MKKDEDEEYEEIEKKIIEKQGKKRKSEVG